MSRILALEDSADAVALIERALSADHDLTCCPTVASALGELASAPLDLLLLDLNLPDGSGMTVAQEISEQARDDAPGVIFLTADRELAAKAAAFSMGADDYLEKPFSILELRLRVTAVLRRLTAARRGLGKRLELGGLVVDPDRLRIRVADSNRPLDLTPTELQLLVRLGSDPDRVMSRRELIREIWPETSVSQRTLDTHVSNLRQKVADYQISIESVRGVGYALSEAPERRAGSGDEGVSRVLD